MQGRLVGNLWRLVTLAVVYAVTAKFGLALAFEHPSATAVWPPTGIALAACLLLGYRVWPGIFAGAFLANITTAGSVMTSLSIALGNTLEAVAGCYLVTRFANGRAAFDRPQDGFKFAGLAALLSTVVSATCGVTSLALGGYADWAHYGPIWLTWWLGDAAGDLIVAPLLLLWSADPRAGFTWARAGEALLALLLIVAVGEGVFGGWFSSGARHYPLEFLSIPILVWVAFRLGRREAATAVVLLSGIAIWGTLSGFGPFAREAPNVALLLLQAYMSVIAVMALVLAAAVAERARTEQERLEEVAERKRAYEALRTSEDLHRAIAELASDFAVTSSVGADGTIRLESATAGFSGVTGYAPAELAGGDWSALVHGEDTALASGLARRLLSGERVTEEIRIVPKHGSPRWVRVSSQPIWDAALQRVGRILSAVQDVTDRREAVEVLSKQQEVIRQLSTPVLRVRERLLILPLIGQIDSGRARQIAEQLLGSIRSNRAKVVVIDLTGVATMDSEGAEHLLRTARACQALGASVIVSGVSRPLGNVLVDTRSDLSALVSKGDLQSGIEEALRHLGYELRPLKSG